MKLAIQRGELQRGLARIQSIVEKRNTMPILAHVYMEAAKKGKEASVLLAATDLEIGFRGELGAAVDRTGALTVSAKKLFEIVRELPEETVRLTSTENHYLEIECARARFVLAGTAAEEYPTLPEATPGHTVRLQAAVLASMIDRTMYATSVDETRYNLNGVYFEVLPKESKIRMVATDGHRLACVDRVVGSDVDGLASGVIIPRKGLAELKRLVDEDDADEVEVGFEGNSGLVRKGGTTLVMRLIEGEFPNYNQVLPESLDQRLVIPSEPLSHALRRVALLSAERSRAVRVEFGDGQLVVSSSNPDLGEAREELDIDYGGEAIAIGFNARYLQDALTALGGKEIELAFRDPLAAVKLTPTDDSEAFGVVMPMRL